MSFHTKGSVGRAAPPRVTTSLSPNDVRTADVARIIDLTASIVRSLLSDPEPSNAKVSSTIDSLVAIIERLNNYRG